MRAAFYQGLQEHGWIEGQNFVLTSRIAHGDSAHLARLVAELGACRRKGLGRWAQTG